MSLMYVFFFFNDTATTEIYTLSLHDALPIFRAGMGGERKDRAPGGAGPQTLQPDHPPARYEALGRGDLARQGADRKSTRLNSSHANISYAVFCLKKKNKHETSYYFHDAVEEF